MKDAAQAPASENSLAPAPKSWHGFGLGATSVGLAPRRLATFSRPRDFTPAPRSSRRRSAPLRRAPLHEPRRIAPPARMGRRDLALHQERVGVEARLLLHDDAVVNER